MRIFFIVGFLFLICSFNGCRHHKAPVEEERPFKITGKIDDTTIKNLIFRYYRCESDSSIIDTIPVINGTFTIDGSISPRTNAYFSINDKQVFFYLDPGYMRLYLKKDSIESSVLQGSKTQSDKEALELETKSLEDYLSNIGTQLSSELNEQNKEILINQKDSIENLLEKIRIDFISSHPNSHFSLDVFFSLLVSKKQNGDVLMNYFTELSDDVKISCSGKQIYNYILQRKKSTITNVSSLEALDKAGTLIKLSDYKGKCILIDFWASWCVPCINGFPHLKELSAKYNGLVVISISIDKEEDEQEWLNAIEKYNIVGWTHILSCKNKGEKNICNLHDNLPGSSIPHYIAIDKSGNVIKQWRGFSDEVAKEQDEFFESIFENNE